MFRCSGNGLALAVKEISRRSQSLSPVHSSVRRGDFRFKSKISSTSLANIIQPGSKGARVVGGGGGLPRSARYASNESGGGGGGKQVTPYTYHADPDDAYEREGDSVKEWECFSKLNIPIFW